MSSLSFYANKIGISNSAIATHVDGVPFDNLGSVVTQDGTSAPSYYQNGKPFDSNGAIAIDMASSTSVYSNGMPFTSAGRLAVDGGNATNSYVNGLPATSENKLAVSYFGADPESIRLNGVYPSLFYDFVNSVYFNTQDGAINFPFTATRTTNATMFDAQGRLVFAPANLLVRSGDFNNAVWVAIGTATKSSPGGRTNPDGTQAIQINIPASGDIVRQLISSVIATPASYTISVWVRQAASGGASNIRITTNNAGAWNTGTSQKFAVTADWTRISMNTSLTTGSSMYVMFGAIDATNTGDATCLGNVELWGAQVELTGVDSPKSYNPTTNAQYYSQRIDTNPETLAPRGLLVEQAGTNLCLNSEDQTNTTGWPNAVNISRTLNQTAPNGLTNGTLVTVTTSSGARVETGNITITNATVYVVSAYLKAGTANAGLSLGNGGGTCYSYVKATLSGAGSVTVGGLGAATSYATIQKCQNGWYRVSLLYTSTTVSVRIAVHPWDGSADQFTYPAGAVNASCSVYGVQLETRALTSLIPTYGASATRAAEITTETIGAWLNTTKGTWYVNATYGQIVTSAFPVQMQMDDGTSANRFHMFTASTNTDHTPGIRTDVASVVQINSGSGIFANFYDVSKTAVSYQASGAKINCNGSVPVATGATTIPTGLTTLRVGTQVGSPDGSRWIAELRYYPDASASDAQLQALTT